MIKTPLLIYVAVVTPTYRPKSVRNRCKIEVFGGYFVLLRCFLDFSVGVGAFVMGLSQISSFKYWHKTDHFGFCRAWLAFTWVIALC